MLSCLIVFGVFAGRAIGQPFALRADTANHRVNDRWTERVPVSGRALVGVTVTDGPKLPTEKGVRPGMLAVIAPLEGTQAVCVRATIEDGRYFAETTFVGNPGPAPGSDLRVLDWNTQYSEQLGDVPWNEIAVLAKAGRCGEDRTVIPATLGSLAPSRNAFLQAFTNTRGSPTWAELRNPAGGPVLRRVRCLRLEQGDRVAFDAVCPLGAPPAGVPAPVLRLVQQSQDGRSSEVVETLTLDLRSLVTGG